MRLPTLQANSEHKHDVTVFREVVERGCHHPPANTETTHDITMFWELMECDCQPSKQIQSINMTSLCLGRFWNAVATNRIEN